MRVSVLSVCFFILTCLGLIYANETAVWSPLFPNALYAEYINRPYPLEAHVRTQQEIEVERVQAQEQLQSVLLNNDVFALYGKPNAYTMGILGQYSLKDIEPIMNSFVKMYDEANGSRGIIPAFYVIYGTCWPHGEIGYLSKKTTEAYIQFALERGWYVYLDHQIGKYSVEYAMKTLLPFLKYPNVHLALDPEWRTTRPMKEIGHVTASEINKAQQMMQDYMEKNHISGRRMLVIHQFNARMIRNRPAVNSTFKRVQLIHCADGFGPPRLKRESYAYNALAKNIPLKSFKLFLKPTIKGAGYDMPLMTPEQVFNLNPRPYLIMYQ